MTPITTNMTVDFLQKVIETWNSYYSKTTGLLTKNPAHMFNGVWSNVVIEAENTTKAVGMALLVCFFFIGLARSYVDLQELRRPEKIFGIFLRYALSVVVVGNFHKILVNIENIIRYTSVSIVNSIGTADASVQIPEALIDKINELSTLQSIMIFIVIVVLGLGIVIEGIFIYIIVLTRFFKVYMYFIVAPIPLSSIAAENTAHIAKSFIKNFIAVCLQGLTIGIACMLFSGIMSFMGTPDISSSDSAMSMVLGWLVETLAMLTVFAVVVKAADSLAKDFVG